MLPSQETKFKEALKYYEMIVQKHTDNILSVSAIVLANLCVSYIMTSQVRPFEPRPSSVQFRPCLARFVTRLAVRRVSESCLCPIRGLGRLVRFLETRPSCIPFRQGFGKSLMDSFPAHDLPRCVRPQNLLAMYWSIDYIPCLDCLQRSGSRLPPFLAFALGPLPHLSVPESASTRKS